MKHVLVAAILAFPVFQEEATKDLFPLKVGTVWTYTSGTAEGRITLAGREKIGEIETYILQSEHPDRLVQKEYISADDKEIKLLRLAVGDQADDYSPPILRLKLPPVKDEAWEWAGLMGKEKASAKFKNEGEETLKVPAGEYKAWKVTVAMELGSMKSTGTNWYAPGVGIVRQLRVTETDGKKNESSVELKSVVFPKK